MRKEHFRSTSWLVEICVVSVKSTPDGLDAVPMVTNDTRILRDGCHRHPLLLIFTLSSPTGSGWGWGTLFTGATNRVPWETTCSRWTWAQVSLRSKRSPQALPTAPGASYSRTQAVFSLLFLAREVALLLIVGYVKSPTIDKTWYIETTD